MAWNFPDYCGLSICLNSLDIRTCNLSIFLVFRLLGFTGAIGTAAYFILPNVYVWQVQQFYQHHSKGTFMINFYYKKLG